MGIAEIRALKLKGSAKLYEVDQPVPVTFSGPKPKKPMNTISEKRKTRDAEIKKAGGNPEKAALELWFHNIAYEYNGSCSCWECGAAVPDHLIRHATAHIFPKKAFPSVSTHPLNYIILAAGCCHDKSHKIESFQKMKMFREAVERFLQFRHLLTKEEKAKKYYTLFLEAATESFPQQFN